MSDLKQYKVAADLFIGKNGRKHKKGSVITVLDIAGGDKNAEPLVKSKVLTEKKTGKKATKSSDKSE